MSKTVTRLFDLYSDALRAMTELEKAGIPARNISIVAGGSERRIDDGRTRTDTVGGDVSVGAVAGGAIGGVGGLLAGLGMVVIPGLGPVVAAGWLAATAVGAAVGLVAGGAVGGLVGALVGAGESEANANVYSEGVRRGGTLISVKAHNDQVGLIENLLDRFNAVSAQARGAAYRERGWDRFDEAAPPYSDDEVRRERDLYRP